MQRSSPDLPAKLHSCLLGIALGDGLGLPCEGLKPRRVQRRLGKVRAAAGRVTEALTPAGQNPSGLTCSAQNPAARMPSGLLPGLLVLSDDSDHAAMALCAYLLHPHDARAFAKNLAWRMRWWLLSFPPGIGLATLRACVKLWVGFSPENSGVSSAGNGVLMRAGILGVALANDEQQRRAYVEASSRMTHSDERALDSARVLAEACAILTREGAVAARNPAQFCQRLAANAASEPLRTYLQRLQHAPRGGLSEYLHVEVFANDPQQACSGISGYAPQSLAAALAVFLYQPAGAVEQMRTAILLGGDCDSVASFCGALAGAADRSAFETPQVRQLCAKLRDIPWNRSTLEQLAAGNQPNFWLMMLRPLRNLLQLPVLLVHVLLRLCGY